LHDGSGTCPEPRLGRLRLRYEVEHYIHIFVTLVITSEIDCAYVGENRWFYRDRLRGVQSLRSEIGYGNHIIELRAFFSLLLYSSLFRVLFCIIHIIQSSITTN
jgi:hypothetical protein